MELDRPTISDFQEAEHLHGAAAAGGPLRYIEKFWREGSYTAGQALWLGVMAEDVDFEADMAGSRWRCESAPSGGDAVCSVLLDGVEVATVTYPDGLTTGVCSCAAWTAPADSDVKLTAPLTPVAGFAGAYGALAGRRVTDGA